MSQLMRLAYGHGGTRLKRIPVSASHLEPAPTPLWLRLVQLVVWIVVPLLVSLYAVPKSFVPTKTIIDISKLTITPPPPAPEKPVLPRVKQTPPIVKPVEPAPKPETLREPEKNKPLERQTVASPPVEMKPPTIRRSSRANLPDISEHQPLVIRERSRVVTGIEAAPQERIRREATTREAPAERTAIKRSRGVTAMDSSIAPDRVAVLRRTTPPGDMSSSGSVIPQRAIQRSRRTTGPAGTADETARHVVAARERSRAVEAGDGESSSSIGLVRGLSLMSLEICSSPQKQEDAIKAVLSVVGSRQSCRNEKGEFQFKGTQRISSFNLMIFPSKGRTPSNRCEELDNAYKCLKTH